jgi:cytochrome c peroxidase
VVDQAFYLGINDNFGDSQTNAPFDPIVFDLYDTWTNAHGRRDDERRAVARGQKLFNTKTIKIRGVAGINDNPDFGNAPVIAGTCTSCHNSPNAGNHSVSLPLDIGLADASRRTKDMPLYTLRHKVTKQIKKTTDPGRAMITGRWQDVSKFKGPILRALAARAPYFHNGSAANLAEVVEFYNDRFEIGLTRREKKDLVAFLRTL